MPVRDVLLDTGPIVAALDRKDQWHRRCVAHWLELFDRCVTTEAVVTEACHLVLRGGGPASLPLEFILSAGIPVLGLEVPSHRRAAALMRRYSDLPMDYADASLVTLASPLGAGTVFTTDRRGFATYRHGRNRTFEIVPS